MKVNRPVFVEIYLLKMLGWYFISDLVQGSYIAFDTENASKEIAALIYSANFVDLHLQPELQWEPVLLFVMMNQVVTTRTCQTSERNNTLGLQFLHFPLNP